MDEPLPRPIIIKPVKDLRVESAIAVGITAIVLGMFLSIWLLRPILTPDADSGGAVSDFQSATLVLESTSVVLTAVGVIVTVATVGLSLLAIYGYRQIRSDARKSASTTATEAALAQLKERLAEGGDLRVLIEGKVDEIIKKPQTDIEPPDEWGYEDSETGDPADYSNDQGGDGDQQGEGALDKDNERADSRGPRP
jgi:hypothetical protein